MSKKKSKSHRRSWQAIAMEYKKKCDSLGWQIERMKVDAALNISSLEKRRVQFESLALYSKLLLHEISHLKGKKKVSKTTLGEIREQFKSDFLASSVQRAIRDLNI